MSQRRYLASTLPDLARDWQESGPDVSGAVTAADDTEQAEYEALTAAADLSQPRLAGLADGLRRRVVVVVESGAPPRPSWDDVVSVHLDAVDDADEDEELGWWATQEVASLIADL